MSTLLTICQDVTKKIGLEVPSAVASSTDREHVELLRHVNVAARDLYWQYDWQGTIARATITTGDGSTTAFDRPSDFLRMTHDARLRTTRTQTALTPIKSFDEWNELQVRQFQFVTGAWIMLNNQLNFMPAPTATETISYYYVKKTRWTDTGATQIENATSDDDTFNLDGGLLTLWTVCKWKMAKGVPYGEDMEDFNTYKERLIIQDGGAKMITVGRVRLPPGVKIAYPQGIS